MVQKWDSFPCYRRQGMGSGPGWVGRSGAKMAGLENATNNNTDTNANINTRCQHQMLQFECQRQWVLSTGQKDGLRPWHSLGLAMTSLQTLLSILTGLVWGQHRFGHPPK